MYGVPSNFDSAFCESHHIHHTKKTGRRTQKRQDELASQTALRVYESNLLTAAMQRCGINGCRQRKRKQERKRKQANDKKLRGAKFYIDFDYSTIDQGIIDEDTNSRNRTLDRMFEQLPLTSFLWAKKKNRNKRVFSDVILESLTKKLAWFNNGDKSQRITSIEGYTEIRLPQKGKKKERNIVRAHPDYRGKGFWLDWIDINWVVDEDHQVIENLPAQVIMILDFDNACYEPIPDEVLSVFPILMNNELHMPQISRVGVHLLVHSAGNKEYAEEMNESIAHRYVMEPFFQLITMENIVGVTFVSRDPPTCDRNEMSFAITAVTAPDKWGGFFVPRHRHAYQIPNDMGCHLDEFNETYNPWVS
jgi:hypothetical protein